MFRIESAGSRGEMRIVDDERHASLQRVAGLGRSPGSAFKLVWDGRVIPFEVVRENQQDPDTGQEYYRTRFLSFGYSATAKSRQGIESYVFADPQERERAQLLAVEGLLLFGGHYDGDTRPEGYDRIELGERAYTKRDFGLP
jgi:hypothetical protein